MNKRIANKTIVRRINSGVPYTIEKLKEVNVLMKGKVKSNIYVFGVDDIRYIMHEKNGYYYYSTCYRVKKK